MHALDKLGNRFFPKVDVIHPVSVLVWFRLSLTCAQIWSRVSDFIFIIGGVSFEGFNYIVAVLHAVWKLIFCLDVEGIALSCFALNNLWITWSWTFGSICRKVELIFSTKLVWEFWHGWGIPGLHFWRHLEHNLSFVLGVCSSICLGLPTVFWSQRKHVWYSLYPVGVVRVPTGGRIISLNAGTLVGKFLLNWYVGLSQLLYLSCTALSCS